MGSSMTGKVTGNNLEVISEVKSGNSQARK